MNSNLLNSVLCIIAAIIWYKFNKWSLKGRDGIKNPEEYSKPSTIAQHFNTWLVIIGCIIASIVFLIKAL